MRKCTPVKHTGETLVIFSLTESDWEANGITERHGGSECFCLCCHQNTIPGGVFPLQSGSLFGSHFRDSASEGKLILQLMAQCPAGSDSEGKMRALSGHTNSRFTYVPKERNSFLSNLCDRK